MRRPVSVAVPLAFLFLSAIPIHAQDPSAEVRRLYFLVGTWTFPYQGSEGTWKCEWFGESFVRCGAEVTNSSGDRVATVDMFAHDAVEGVYSWHRFLTNGIPEAASGWLQNDTWTFVFDEPVERKRRASFLPDTPGVFTLRWENSLEGGIGR